MNRASIRILIAAATSPAVISAANAAPPTKTVTTSKGPALTDAGDTAGDNYTVVARDDGSRQWAYKGKPLYTFVKDQKGGDITGDGFLNGAWHLAQP